MGILTVLVVTLLATLTPAISSIRAYLWYPQDFNPQKALMTVAVILGAAIAMGALRKSHLQMWYGLLEISISAVWFFNVTLLQSKLPTGPARVVELVTCAYLMKRGVDNVFDGTSKWRKYVPPAEKSILKTIARLGQ